MRLTAYRISDHAMPIVPASRERQWMKDTPAHFADRCLPLSMANAAGWWLLNPEPFKAWWNRDENKEAITIKGNNPLVSSHFGSGILTFSIPYLFRTSPGYNLLVRGPANMPKDCMTPLEGLVETDWSPATFTMNWKFTGDDAVEFTAGEPVAQLVPMRRYELEEFAPHVVSLEDDEMQSLEYREWAESRRKFNDNLRVTGSDAQKAKWQKDYIRSGRQRKLKLRPFE